MLKALVVNPSAERHLRTMCRHVPAIFLPMSPPDIAWRGGET